MYSFPDTDLRYIKGVGPKRVHFLNKIGIQGLSDLLLYRPFRYEDRTSPVELSNASFDQDVLLRLFISDRRRMRRNRLDIIRFRASDSTGNINISFFNQKYVFDKIIPGKTYYFYGRLKKDEFGYNMNSPEFSEKKEGFTGIIPVYELTKGLSLNVFRKIVKSALTLLEDTEYIEYLPENLIVRYEIEPLFRSIYNIHFPKDFKALTHSVYCMKYREIFFMSFAFSYLKGLRKKEKGILFRTEGLYKDFERLLPFELTQDQKDAVNRLEQDMKSGIRMNRLLQGDVGAGKTIVVSYMLYIAVRNNKKAVFLAPTDVLATQHFNNLKNLFKNEDIDIVLIKGGNYKGKKASVKKLTEDRPLIAIGTHALFQKNMEYRDVGIVVIDEQHRFGVAQRLDMVRKTQCPNILVMSATPIPRTLALTAYGDMEYIEIRHKPDKRLPVRTFVREENALPGIYDFLRKRVKAGERVFIITPLVEESEKLELKSVEKVYHELKERVFPDLGLAALHGRMKSSEKNRIMEEFSEGNIQILISTTVVEVGVDVPEATVILIKNAERFGVAQLHQLRGRVGRGDRQSYCILVHPSGISAHSLKRLRLLESSEDGFYLAEQDMRLRGAGDFFGQRQHGFGIFRFTIPSEDRSLIEKVRKEVHALFSVHTLENISDILLDYVCTEYIGDYDIL